MESRSNTLIRIATPLKNLVQRFMYLGLVLSAFGFMLLGKFDTASIDEMRLEVTEAITPLLEALSQPAATASPPTAFCETRAPSRR